MTKMLNFGLKIKGAGREGGTCKVPPPKKKIETCIYAVDDIVFLIDDSVKGGLTQFWGTLYHDSLRAKIFKTLIISLFEYIWVSN